MARDGRARRGVPSAVLASLLLAAVACGGSSGGGAGGGGTKDTLVFAGSADPKVLDGALVSDGESFRVIRQIFEGLVTTKPGGTQIGPRLAESWQPSRDGRQWTFALRRGVRFSDGTPFDAAAVCANFERWYSFQGILASASTSYYWLTVFGGYRSDGAESLYRSCTTRGPATAVITLTRPSASFLPALSLPAFSMASPSALRTYRADAVSGSSESPKFLGTFGTQHPVGTGPYKLESWNPGDRLVLVRNDDYWGPRAKIRRVIIRPIADGPARFQALQAGDVDGYDLVDAGDIARLKDAGFQVLFRPAFNVGYVSINQKKKPLDNLKVREAIIYALDREALVRAKYAEGSQVAKEFLPPEVFGYANDVPSYTYDPAKAKQLLAEAGVPHPTVEFWYPTNVSRPYMPDPQANFQAFQADLERVGFRVVAKSAPWRPDYLDAILSGRHGLALFGWAGDFGDPDNFLGTLFKAPRPEFGFTNRAIFDLLQRAAVELDPAKRTAMYQQANRSIMRFVPGVPYVHTRPALAFAKGVAGFVPSPVQNEDFAAVTVK